MKKILVLVLSLLLMLTLFAGCDTKETTDENEVTDKKEVTDNKEEQSEEKEGETLEIWAFFEGLPKVAADYYSDISGVEVDYVLTTWNDYQVKLASSLGTNEVPDILQLPIHFLGRFANTGFLMDLDEAYGGRKLYESYKANTAVSTLESGYFEGVPIGIGWEANVGVYYYREDIAREAFGINSVEEMEEIISTWEGFYTLNEMKKPGYEDVTVFSEFIRIVDALLAVTPQYVVDGKFEFNPELIYVFTEMKKLVDSGMIYIDGQDETAVVNAAKEDKHLGNLIESWWVPNCKEFEQPGLWRAADPPVHFTNGGTWWAVPVGADKEKGWDFLTETFLSEEWLYENLSELGNYIANNNVMDRAVQEGALYDEYFGDQIIGEKFIEIGEKTTEIKPKSEYFMNIRNILCDKIREYAWDGVYSSLDETLDAVEEQINSMFPEIEVIR